MPLLTTDRAKEVGAAVSVTTLISWVTIAPAVWFFLKPPLMAAVTEDIHAEISKEVSRQVKPIYRGLTALVAKDVTDLRIQIVEKTYQKSQGTNWTSQDAKDLEALRLELEASQEALDQLKGN
jgi:hypothetical protein